MLRHVIEYVYYCLTETENVETYQDLLAFDINMNITTRTNEYGEANGDGKDKSKDSWLPLFSLASITAATENFSMQCKLGEGGFGPVYKVEFLILRLSLMKYC